MNTFNSKVVLVTGGNSGLGFEAAAQLADAGFGTIILAARNEAKGEQARKILTERTGKDVFETVAMDLGELESVDAAAAELARRGAKIDFLLLNAGISKPPPPEHNSAGIELTFAVANIGHHRFTMRLLEAGLLAGHARIVMAGSEAARGDVPGMKIPEFQAYADEHHGGDLEAAFESMARATPPFVFKQMDTYAISKSFSAWWSAVLASKLPEGMTVNTVSPGSAPQTNFLRHSGFLMKHIMLPMMKVIGPMMSMAGTLEEAAHRYITAASYDDKTSGNFYASPPKKLVGPVSIQKQPHITSRAYQETSWNVMVKLGEIGYPAAA